MSQYLIITNTHLDQIYKGANDKSKRLDPKLDQIIGKRKWNSTTFILSNQEATEFRQCFLVLEKVIILLLLLLFFFIIFFFILELFT